MYKIKHYCGIDVSKDTIDVMSIISGHKVFENNLVGFRELLKCSSANTHFVMEATGVYHEKLAHFLFNKGYSVSVLNPMIVKRFSQMLLRSTKTDRADADMVFKYASTNDPELWEPPAAYIEACKDLNGVLSLMLKQRTALKNKYHSLQSKGCKEAKAIKCIKQSINHLNRHIEQIEEQMELYIAEHEPELYNQLKSIPGIGTKTAVFLIVITNGFRQFESSKQVSSYLGMSPSIRTSGSSVRGQSRITKTGNGHIRNLLFLSSFTACKYNPACKEMFDRITEKGKSKKLALIAVANKLIKQAFALAKSGNYFNPEHLSLHPAMR